MRSIIGKFNASVFRLIISALLLGTCNEAFSLNTQPIQNPPTYTGTLQGEAPCNTTYRTTGFRPVDPSAPGAKYPLFLYFAGTSFSDADMLAQYTSIAGQAVTAAMAARGFVSVSVQYDNRFTSLFDNSLSAQGIQNKLACMFGSSNADSLVVKLCALKDANGNGIVDCSLGIATWGHSQGALISVDAAQYDHRVNAAFATGYASSSPAPAPTLAFNRIRLANGENDSPNNNTSYMNNAVGVTSQDCPGAVDQCLRPDGSGWILVRQAQLLQNQADHCWFGKTSCSANNENLEPNWTPGTTSPFSLAATANWLAAAAVQSRSCPSARLALQAQANNNYVSARLLTGGVPVQATSTSVADWEKFTCLEKGNGQIILQAANGMYVYADPLNNQQLSANSSLANATIFQVVNQGPNTIAVKAVSNGKYVSADLTLMGQLIANRSSVATWETFTVIPQ
jgi:hypothetical protein